MTYVLHIVNRQSLMERLIQNLSLESYRYRTIPLKHAHVARLPSQLNRTAPATSIVGACVAPSTNKATTRFAGAPASPSRPRCGLVYVTRVRLRNFCFTAKDRVSSPLDGLLRGGLMARSVHEQLPRHPPDDIFGLYFYISQKLCAFFR